MALARAKEVTVSHARGGWKPPFHGFGAREGSYRQSRGGRLEASIPWHCRAQESYLKTADAHGVRYLRGRCRGSPWNGGFPASAAICCGVLKRQSPPEWWRLLQLLYILPYYFQYCVANTARSADTAPANTARSADTASANTARSANTAPANTARSADTASADTSIIFPRASDW